MSDVTFHMRMNTMEVHHKKASLEITLVDTGDVSMTEGDLNACDYLRDEAFVSLMVTDLLMLISHH